MSAIITDKFRRNSVATFIADAATTDYYIGIGKSDEWQDQGGYSENSASFVVPGAYGSMYEMAEAKENLMSMTKVPSSDMRHVIPRVNLNVGQKYKVYDHSDPDCFFAEGDMLPCYAYYENNNGFYVCLRNAGGGVTTNLPADVANQARYTPQLLADGYIWAFVENLETNSLFDTSQYLAVSGIVGATEQGYATSETGGMLYGFGIEDGGTGYDIADMTVKFIGTRYDSAGNEENFEFSSDDSSTPLSFTVSGGVITSVDVPNPTNVSLFEKGFIKGSVNIIDNTSAQSGGRGARIIPLVAPINGFGYDPIGDLPTFFLGMSATFDADQGGDAMLVPYRQISVIKNPSFTATSADPDATTADALPWFDVTGTPDIGNLSVNDIMKIANAGEEATSVFYDSHDVNGGNTRVFFHQNTEPDVNAGAVPPSGAVTGANDAALFTYTGISEPEYDRRSGDVIFLENRKPIIRSAAQSEKIKVILQF